MDFLGINICVYKNSKKYILNKNVVSPLLGITPALLQNGKAGWKLLKIAVTLEMYTPHIRRKEDGQNVFVISVETVAWNEMTAKVVGSFLASEYKSPVRKTSKR